MTNLIKRYKRPRPLWLKIASDFTVGISSVGSLLSASMNEKTVSIISSCVTIAALLFGSLYNAIDKNYRELEEEEPSPTESGVN